MILASVKNINKIKQPLLEEIEQLKKQIDDLNKKLKTAEDLSGRFDFTEQSITSGKIVHRVKTDDYVVVNKGDLWGLFYLYQTSEGVERIGEICPFGKFVTKKELFRYLKDKRYLNKLK